jgi:uncharacterized membrane protein YfcA
LHHLYLSSTPGQGATATHSRTTTELLLLLHPTTMYQVAAATSATMILFTSASACLVFVRFGHILYDYAGVLVVLGFFVTLCSQLLTFLLIKLLGRRSIIVFSMVALMVSVGGTCVHGRATRVRACVQALMQQPQHAPQCRASPASHVLLLLLPCVPHVLVCRPLPRA